MITDIFRGEFTRVLTSVEVHKGFKLRYGNEEQIHLPFPNLREEVS